MTKYLILLVATLAFVSCRKEIDLKLKSSEPQYVMKGLVEAGDSVHYVEITKTVAFDQLNEFPTVSGAVVTLKDNLGNSEVLLETTPGRYETLNFMAFEERSYTMEISHDGNNFVASCAIPKKVPLQGVDFIPNQFFGAEGLLVVPKYQDPTDAKNFYIFNYRDVNDVKRKTGTILREDGNTNGQVNQQPLFEGFSLQPGDTISFKMYGIAETTYVYYFSKAQNTNPNSGAPANPVTNWNNDALGYFMARNQQSLEFIIPQ
jgi:hypothetical protein